MLLVRGTGWVDKAWHGVWASEEDQLLCALPSLLLWRDRMRLRSHREGCKAAWSGSRRTGRRWPGDLTPWVSHFVSQPFPRVASFSRRWCILQISAPKLSFALRFMVNVFSHYLSQRFTTLSCRTSCFPSLSWETKRLPSLHAVNRCLCDTCYSQRSYQIRCLFPCIVRRIAYWKPHNNTNDFIKKKEQLFYRKLDVLIPPLISLLSSWNFSGVVPRQRSLF